MKMTGFSEKLPRPTLIEAMYAAKGVTAIRVNTGCVAYSKNLDDAIAAPSTRATTTAMANPMVACRIVSSAALK